MVNFYIYYNMCTRARARERAHTHTHIYIFINIKITINPKQYTGIDQYLKYIVPLTKPVQY